MWYKMILLTLRDQESLIENKEITEPVISPRRHRRTVTQENNFQMAPISQNKCPFFSTEAHTVIWKGTQPKTHWWDMFDANKLILYSKTCPRGWDLYVPQHILLDERQTSTGQVHEKKKGLFPPFSPRTNQCSDFELYSFLQVKRQNKAKAYLNSIIWVELVYTWWKPCNNVAYRTFKGSVDVVRFDHFVVSD